MGHTTCSVVGFHSAYKDETAVMFRKCSTLESLVKCELNTCFGQGLGVICLPKPIQTLPFDININEPFQFTAEHSCYCIASTSLRVYD